VCTYVIKVPENYDMMHKYRMHLQITKVHQSNYRFEVEGTPVQVTIIIFPSHVSSQSTRCPRTKPNSEGPDEEQKVPRNGMILLHSSMFNSIIGRWFILKNEGFKRLVDKQFPSKGICSLHFTLQRYECMFLVLEEKL
jgi:hypothetical protein